jgi:lipoprotein-releasing system ATP-binding protein
MLLQLNNISKSFSNADKTISRTVLEDLDFQLEAGETAAVVGPSGSGKTTLLNLIALLDKPDSGRVVFNGEHLSAYTKSQINTFRNQEIGFVFQKHHLLPQCTLWENILLPALVSEEKRDVYEARAEKLTDILGVSHLHDQKPGELSGGECQRAAVIRALINEPSLLLADEPTGSLDEKNAHELMQLLADVNKKTGTALIVVTHADRIAQKMQKIYRLTNGKLSSH